MGKGVVYLVGGDLLLSVTVAMLAVSVVFAVLPTTAASSSLAGEGMALMNVKASFRNVANVLQDWDGASGEDDHCSWRGVVCHNVTFSVVSLYVVLIYVF